MSRTERLFARALLLLTKSRYRERQGEIPQAVVLSGTDPELQECIDIIQSLEQLLVEE